MASVEQSPAVAATDSQLPMRKRKKAEDADVASATAVSEPESKAQKEDDNEGGPVKAAKRPGMNKAREIRLEQNRKAARESRRRKKIMIEELQRSVIFFSRANGTLKQQNDDLTRLLLQAQAQVSSIESGEQTPATSVAAPAPATEAKLLAESSVPSSQPVSAAAAAMAGTLPPMHPGATMQAMANFQQAASAAMQVAVQGMKGIPGATMQAFITPTTGEGAVNPQQAYNDTMTALAMQQAAAAAAASGQLTSPAPAAENKQEV